MRQFAQRLTLAGVVLTVIVGTADPARAVPTTGGHTNDDSVVIDIQDEGGGGGDPGRVVWPRWVATYLPACRGNDPNVVGADVNCAAAGQLCAYTPDPADLMYQRFRALQQRDGSRSQWQSAGTLCLRREDVPGQGRPEFSVADFRRLPLPPGRAGVEPGSGRVLVNVPVNLFVDAGPVELDTTLLGLAFQVRATPVEFVWDLGNGDELVTSDPGARYPEMTTTYTYRTALDVARSDLAVTLTTVYSGEYSFAGSDWLPIDGVARVVSAPIPVDVVEAHRVLVAEP